MVFSSFEMYLYHMFPTCILKIFTEALIYGTTMYLFFLQEAVVVLFCCLCHCCCYFQHLARTFLNHYSVEGPHGIFSSKLYFL